MRRVRPTLLVLAELELWPNLIAAAKRHGAQVAIINGRLERQELSRLPPHAAARGARAAAGRSDRRAERRRRPSGSARWAPGRRRCTSPARSSSTAPRPIATIRARAELRRLAGIARRRHRVPRRQHAGAGGGVRARRSSSDSPPTHPELRLILVPRHPERFDEVAALLDRSGVAWQRRSELRLCRRTPIQPRHRQSREPLARAAGRHDRRARRLVGRRDDRLRRRQLRQPRRAEHDRAGGLRRRDVLRPQHLELPRHRRPAARRRRRRRRARRGGVRGVRAPRARRSGMGRGAGRSGRGNLCCRSRGRRGGRWSCSRAWSTTATQRLRSRAEQPQARAASPRDFSGSSDARRAGSSAVTCS